MDAFSIPKVLLMTITGLDANSEGHNAPLTPSPNGSQGKGAGAPLKGRRLRKCVGLLLATMASAALTFFVFGEVMIAPAACHVPLEATNLPVRTVTFSTPDGTVNGWGVDAQNPKGTVLLLHGLRASRLAMLDRAEFLYRNQFSVIMIDLQAHGESSGKAITFGHREGDGVSAALNSLQAQDEHLPVFVLGVSLGGASFLLSEETDVQGVILEAVYPTIAEALWNRLAAKAGSWFATPVSSILLAQTEWRLGIERQQLQPIDQLPALRCPVFMMCGQQDMHTTPKETRRMFESLVSADDPQLQPNLLWLIPDAGHVDLHGFQKDDYEQRVTKFLNGCVLQATR